MNKLRHEEMILPLRPKMTIPKVRVSTATAKKTGPLKRVHEPAMDVFRERSHGVMGSGLAVLFALLLMASM